MINRSWYRVLLKYRYGSSVRSTLISQDRMPARLSASAAAGVSAGEPEQTTLSVPVSRQCPQALQRLGGELDRLPAVENGFDDVGSEEGERQDAHQLVEAETGTGADGLGRSAPFARILRLNLRHPHGKASPWFGRQKRPAETSARNRTRRLRCPVSTLSSIAQNPQKSGTSRGPWFDSTTPQD